MRKCVWYGVCKINFIILVGLELIRKTKGIVKVNPLTSSIIIQQKEIIIVILAFHELWWTSLILITRNIILFVLYVFTTLKPAQTLCFIAPS